MLLPLAPVFIPVAARVRPKLGTAFEASELSLPEGGVDRSGTALGQVGASGSQAAPCSVTFPTQAAGTPSSRVTCFLLADARRVTCLDHAPLDPSEATGK